MRLKKTNVNKNIFIFYLIYHGGQRKCVLLKSAL